MKRKKHLNKTIRIALFSLLFLSCIYSQKPYRVGTTTANFLEIGMGSAGIAMGDAHVSSVQDLSAIYWNPAGLALMDKNEAFFMHQPWVADVSNFFAGVGFNIPIIGTVALGVTGVDYGETEVTTMEYQNGTGEKYSAQDMAISLSYGRSLTDWFAFGATLKYITSKIWHSEASAFAMDLGVIVNTHFFSVTGKREDGLRIGMSISNYGSRMQYDGDDLLFPYDQEEDALGSYERVQGKYKTAEWELPLMFRVGISVDPIVTNNQRLTLSVDALHPNNMSEHLNVGAQYQFNVAGTGSFYLRGGYKALFLDNSEYGATFGGGVKIWSTPNLGFKFDYSYHSIGVLGNINSFSVGMMF